MVLVQAKARMDSAVRDSYRTAIPLYGSGGFTNYSLERLGEQFGDWVDRGTSRTKIKYGWPLSLSFCINQGPIMLMIANYHSGLVCNAMKRCSYIVDGLRRAGLAGGWLAA